jgi:hypothetical protein
VPGPVQATQNRRLLLVVGFLAAALLAGLTALTGLVGLVLLAGLLPATLLTATTLLAALVLLSAVFRILVHDISSLAFAGCEP